MKLASDSIILKSDPVEYSIYSSFLCYSIHAVSYHSLPTTHVIMATILGDAWETKGYGNSYPIFGGYRNYGQLIPPYRKLTENMGIEMNADLQLNKMAQIQLIIQIILLKGGRKRYLVKTSISQKILQAGKASNS